MAEENKSEIAKKEPSFAKATDGQGKKSPLALREEQILKFWQENKIFEKTLEKTKDKKPFVFYDGPPFATGTPHYGHLVASVMKDSIPRYQTMRGRYAERQWGWDTHGLPIEQEVEKELGIKSKKEIEEIGVEKFNNLCREKVFTYVDVWNKFIPRFGRWADMDNPYRTMDTSYMESEWWAFKELFDKNLIYKDYRSMHICPRCETTLAQAEVAEGYETIKDIAVTAKFELVDEPSTFVLAWTTTPWTLPGNVALAVGEDIDYVQNEDNLIFAKNLLENIKGASKNIKKEFKGKDLIGKSYKPLFSHYADDSALKNRENGWKIYGASFVTTESGTGVVHIAPAFGEDDMELGREKNLPFVQHLGMDGIIKTEVKELAGLSVKPKGDPQSTDIEILKLLASKDLIFSKEKYEHSYPHCWRCETPLLNYATSSWFVAVTKVKKELLDYAKEINWSPKHIKEGRWLDWLENARDWSISRQRFWANTIPVWENEENEEKLVIGSIEELKKYTKKSRNKYIAIRHSEAKSNVENYVDSGEDKTNHLTEKGEKTTLAKAQELKKENIDIIISSPVLRAKETAEIISKELGIEIIYDERIREKNFGKHSGETFGEHAKIYKDVRDKFKARCPDGENEIDVRLRMGDFIYDIDSKYSHKNILIISHGTPIHFLFSISVGEENKKALENVDYLQNSEVKNLDFNRLPHNESYELDLHRPYVDRVELIDEKGLIYKRTTDVLDTWFDSGSVPFSSYHYPFENKEKVESRIPADFIAEGVDQVSKWFYYQHVLSTSLFQGPVFKNVAVNGIVLAEDGKKMSKRLQNYPDPVSVVDKYGADAVRFYLLSSQVMRADNVIFSEGEVDEVYKKLILRLQNTLSFYEMYGRGEVNGKSSNKNILDQWIKSRLGELYNEVTSAMDEYELDRATRPFINFVDDFSTWYIRRSRDRFKGDNEEDKNDAILTTRYVLLELSKLIAPFTPFIAEDLYKRVGGEVESVHLEDWPEVGDINENVLNEMKEVRNIVSLGLESRSKSGIKVRQPLSKLKVKSQKLEGRDNLIELVRDEVNIKEVEFTDGLENEVELDTIITPELQAEGNSRELIRQIQNMRKNKGLKPEDRVNLTISSDGDISFVDTYEAEIRAVCGLNEIKKGSVDDGEEVIIDGISIKIKLLK